MSFRDKLSISKVEFILMMAFLMSMAALPTDAILPALPDIAKDVIFYKANDIQYIISSFMMGVTLGQLLYGPMSDSFGRKISVYVGLFLFIISCIGSIFSDNCYEMIFFRFLQGFGVVSARVLVVTIVRDILKGKEMANLMSIVVSVFIFIPAVAPALGQVILEFFSWHHIFTFFIAFTLVGAVWLHFRLPETLKEEDKREFSLKSIKEAFFIVMTNKIVVIYIIIGGLSFGAFMGYLISAQVIFHEYFEVGEMFAVYFSVGAASIGISSLANSKVVHHFPLLKVAKVASLISFVASVIFMTVFYHTMMDVPLYAFVAYISFVMFCAGFVFGNVNALAMEPLGKVAGMASSVIGMFSNLIAVLIGAVIGQLYNGTLTPVILGYLLGYMIIYFLLVKSAKMNKKLEEKILIN